jgi:hypothetical protein
MPYRTPGVDDALRLRPQPRHVGVVDVEALVHGGLGEGVSPRLEYAIDGGS